MKMFMLLDNGRSYQTVYNSTMVLVHHWCTIGRVYYHMTMDHVVDIESGSIGHKLKVFALSIKVSGRV